MYPVIRNSFSFDSFFSLEDAAKAVFYAGIFRLFWLVVVNRIIIYKNMKYSILVAVFRSHCLIFSTIDRPIYHLIPNQKIPIYVFVIIAWLGVKSLHYTLDSHKKLSKLKLRNSKKFRDLSDEDYEKTITKLMKEFKEKKDD